MSSLLEIDDLKTPYTPKVSLLTCGVNNHIAALMGRDEECYDHEPKCFALDGMMLSNPGGKITMLNPYHYYFDLKYWNPLPCQTTVQCHSFPFDPA